MSKEAADRYLERMSELKEELKHYDIEDIVSYALFESGGLRKTLGGTQRVGISPDRDIFNLVISRDVKAESGHIDLITLYPCPARYSKDGKHPFALSGEVDLKKLKSDKLFEVVYRELVRQGVFDAVLDAIGEKETV